jgi:hypothetical protein
VDITKVPIATIANVRCISVRSYRLSCPVRCAFVVVMLYRDESCWSLIVMRKENR